MKRKHDGALMLEMGRRMGTMRVKSMSAADGWLAPVIAGLRAKRAKE